MRHWSLRPLRSSCRWWGRGRGRQHFSAAGEGKDETAVEQFVHPGQLQPGQLAETIGVLGGVVLGAARGVLDAGPGVEAQEAVTPAELVGRDEQVEFDRLEALADEVGERMGDGVSLRRVQVAEGQV